MMTVAIICLIFVVVWYMDGGCDGELQRRCLSIMSGLRQFFNFAKYYYRRKFLNLKVNEYTKQNGGDLVAQVLKAHGVDHVFTLCGGHVSPILVSSENMGIKIIDVRHEASSVFAADAVSRMTGKIGVSCVTAGPGLTNTVTAIKNAQMAESPVLLLGGSAATLLKGRGALQDIDQMALFKPLCKYTATIRALVDIVPTLKEAIAVAQSGTPGPVFVEFPIDTLYCYTTIKKELGIKPDATNILLKLAQWYMVNHVDNIFAGAFDENYDLSPLKLDVPLPTDAQVDCCIELLRSCKRPLLLIGSQATLPPITSEQLANNITSLGIPCYLGGMARGLLGRQSAIQMRQRRKEALKEADLVILAGAVCDFRLSYGRILSRKSKIIAINRNRDQLFKNSDSFWKPTVAIQADVSSTLDAITRKMPGFKVDPQWVTSLRDKDNEKETDNLVMMNKETEQHLNPLKVLSELDTVISDDAVMVADGGDFISSAAYILRPRGPLKWLDPGAFGTLGVGGGFALGAKLVNPGSEVWLLWGDGSSGFSLAEIDSFTRHKMPVIALIGNDAGWTQILREQIPMLGSDTACKLAYTDYHKVGEGYGGKGILVTRADGANLKAKLREAQRMSAEGHSVVINVLIGSTKFRDGSLSV